MRILFFVIGGASAAFTIPESIRHAPSVASAAPTEAWAKVRRFWEVESLIFKISPFCPGSRFVRPLYDCAAAPDGRPIVFGLLEIGELPLFRQGEVSSLNETPSKRELPILDEPLRGRDASDTGPGVLLATKKSSPRKY